MYRNTVSIAIKDAVVSGQDEVDRTALSHAVEIGSQRVAEVLPDAGAQVSVRAYSFDPYRCVNSIVDVPHCIGRRGMVTQTS